MYWKKIESLAECCRYYINTKTEKYIKLSYYDLDRRKTKKFEKLRKIRIHKKLLFQIKFFIYKDTVKEEQKQSFNFYRDPIGSDKLFNTINDINLKQYKLGVIKDILRHIFIRDSQSLHLFIDEFFSILPSKDMQYKADVMERGFNFSCFVVNNIKFFDRFDLLGLIRFSSLYKDSDFLKENIDEYDKTSETLWRKKCLENLKRDETIRLKQEKEVQEKYRYKLRQHKYFSYFGER